MGRLSTLTEWPFEKVKATTSLNFVELRAWRRTFLRRDSAPSVMSCPPGGLAELTRRHKGRSIIASKAYNGSNRTAV